MNTSQQEQKFVATRFRESVVKVKKSGGLLTGFFVGAGGWLVTALHGLYGRERPKPLAPVHISVEIKTSDANSDWIEDEARLEPAWFGSTDWAVLQLKKYRHGVWLPLATSNSLVGTDGLQEMDALISYGYPKIDIASIDIASMGDITSFALSGSIANFAERTDYFFFQYMNAGEGHSGGPVYHVPSKTVIGVMIQQHHKNPHIGVAVDFRGLLAACQSNPTLRDGLGVHLDTTRKKWKEDLAAAFVKAYEPLDVISPPDKLDEHHVHRKLENQVASNIQKGQRVVHLHGGPGVGKTTLMKAVAIEIMPVGRNCCWYDFEQHGRPSLAHLTHSLALHLAKRYQDFGPISSLPEALNRLRLDEWAELFQTVTRALASHRAVLFLDNAHLLDRHDEGDSENERAIRNVLMGVAKASGDTLQLCVASWNRPFLDAALVCELPGFNEEETQRYLNQFQLRAEVRTENFVKTCISLAPNLAMLGWYVGQAVKDGKPPDVLFGHSSAEVQADFQKRIVSRLSSTEYDALLACSIVDAPLSGKGIVAIGGPEIKPEVYTKLTASPPLLSETQGYYSPHSLLRMTVRKYAETRTDDKGRVVVRAFHERAGQYYQDTGDHLVAAAHYRRAGQNSQALTLLASKTQQLLSQGHFDELMRAIEDIASEIHFGPETDERINLLLQVGEVKTTVLHHRGKYDTAIKYYGQLIQMSAQNDSRRWALMTKAADCCRLASRYEEASQIYKKVKDQTAEFDSHGKWERNVKATLGLAKIARLQCDYETALRFYDDVRIQFEMFSIRTWLSESEFGCGEICRLRSHPERENDPQLRAAETWYHQSLSNATQARNDERRAYALWGLGEVQRLRGQTVEAAVIHRQGLRLCEQVGDVRSAGWASLGLADSARMAGAFDLAAGHYADALRRFEATGSQTEITHARLGRVELARNMRQDGLDKIEEVQQLIEAYRTLQLNHCLAMALLVRSLMQKSSHSDMKSLVLDEGKNICARHKLEWEGEIFQRLEDGKLPPDFVLPLNYP